MDGLECSEIMTMDLDKLQNRLDAEFYRKHNLECLYAVCQLCHKSIEQLNLSIDCSAFYPGVVDIYNFEKNGIPFLRVNEITNFGLVSISEETAFLPKTFLDANKSTMARCASGDIIIAKGGNTLAKTGIVSDEYEEYATCRDIIILRTNRLESSLRYYLWAYLQSSYGKSLLWQTASQTGQPHLTIDYIKALKVPLFHDALYESIADCQKRSQTIKLQADKLYHDAENLLLSALSLENFTPSKQNNSIKRFSAVNASGRLDAEYYQVKYDEIEYRIKNNACVTAYSILSDGNKNYEPIAKETYIYIELSNIDDYGGINDNFIIAKGEELPTRARRQVVTGDVVISSIEGSLGSCAIISKEYNHALCSTGFYIMSTDKINSETLLLLFKSYPIQMLMKRGCNGTILTAISVDELKRVFIPNVSKLRAA